MNNEFKRTASNKKNLSVRHTFESTDKSLPFSHVWITKALLLIAFLFLICHITVVTLIDYSGATSGLPFSKELADKLYGQFHLAADGNLPTYFSSLLLAIASLLLYVTHKLDKKKTYHWLLLSLIFLFLSIDESAMLHENFAGIIGKKIKLLLKSTSSFFAWAWVIPYGVLTLLTGLYFMRFTLKLPNKTRNLFFLSGSIYVFAALFLEVLEAHFETKFGATNLINEFLYPCEEVLEMAGIIIFIYAILDYLKLNHNNFQISIAEKV